MEIGNLSDRSTVPHVAPRHVAFLARDCWCAAWCAASDSQAEECIGLSRASLARPARLPIVPSTFRALGVDGGAPSEV